VAEADEWIADGRFFDVTVFSDVSARDGLGRVLSDVAPAPGRGVVFEVFRGDAGTVPTITGTTFQPVAPDLVGRFAKTAVLDLLHGVLREGRTDWLPTNIARALSWAGRRVSRWWGPEWPLSERVDGAAEVYAGVGADAVPYARLGLSLDTGDVEVGTYQDDTYFGLHFDPQAGGNLRDYDSEYFRIHNDLPLPTRGRWPKFCGVVARCYMSMTRLWSRRSPASWPLRLGRKVHSLHESVLA
jgi:hypothetical protein